MRSILIVDDEEGLRSSLVTAFGLQGYQAAGAAAGPAALELLAERHFDVLLTDLVMGEMDGLTLLERVRPRYPDTAIVLMTGGATVESAVRALKGGAADYVLKPFTLTEIFHVAERAQEQHRLRRENVQLSEFNRRLTELDQVKSDLLSAVTHEFRTPLTVMQGWLDLLLGSEIGTLSRAQQESLTSIRGSVVRLGRLIANLLVLADSQAGRLPDGVAPVSLGGLLGAAAEELAPEAAEREVGLLLEVDASAGQLLGDGERLRLLALNLLENAIKFSAPGGQVRAAVRREGDRVEVCIANSTGELAPEQLPSLLQPFTQGDMGLRRPAGGLGLGLAVVRAVAHAHGGSLRVETAPGHGTAVSVRFPAFEAPGPTRAAGAG